MDRRSFFHSATAAGLLAQSPESGRKTRLYRIDYFYYRQGTQAGRLNQFFSSQAPLLARHTRALGFFNAVFAPRLQTLMVLSGFESMDGMMSAASQVEADAGYQKAFEGLESGSEPPFDTSQRLLLAATDFSPEIVPLAEKPKSPRYFELRVYHSPTVRQLHMLHERFGGAEVHIFHRSGIHPILYADTIVGPDLPNLTYFMPFATLADREKAWDAFGADPEWVKVRADSVARGGQIVDNNNLSLWRATPYSPIQ
ncbi:putative NIPSNAP family containing protein [Candidatus Sulfopaludibacter sp. SbA3]|nr:putative NIPSNAP family containing protein [Candidatus Sulfopaludibacter sp. SbA3]